MVWYLIGAQTGVLTDTNISIFGGIGNIFRYWYQYAAGESDYPLIRGVSKESDKNGET